MKKLATLLTIATCVGMCFSNRAEAEVMYVTDTGGYAYDESRAATNLAPAIALSTVAIVAVVALAVQNSHCRSSSSSSSSAHVHSTTTNTSSSSSSSSS